MKNERILANALAAIGQVTVAGIGLFVLYHYVFRQLGAELLGVWSVVFAASTLGRLGDLGFGVGMVKFVAESRARETPQQVAELVETSVVTVAVAAGAVLAVAFPVIDGLLGVIMRDPARVAEGRAILPLAFAATWLSAVASVYAGSVDGTGKVYLRSLAFSVGVCVNLALAFLLVPALGLAGLAFAQVGFSATVLVLAAAFLRSEVPGLALVPHRWKSGIFRRMLVYGANVQVATIVQIVSDPLIKGLLGRFGGLAATGYYEMASRMVLQLRLLLVAANQALLPALVEAHLRSQEAVSQLYQRSYRLVFAAAALVFVAIAGLSPFVSRIWLGYYEPVFVWMSAILAVAWFGNSVVTPAYFMHLASGRLRWNTLSHLTIGGLAVVLGGAGGVVFGTFGVVGGWSLALLAGSLIVIVGYHRDEGERWRDAFTDGGAAVVVGSVLGAGLAVLSYTALEDSLSAVPLLTVGVAAYGILAIPAAARHPLVRGLAAAVKEARRAGRRDGS